MADYHALLSFYTGVALAVISTLFIGVGFILKKTALIRAKNRGLSAGDGRVAYLRDWLWWSGLLLFALGEGANFVAYALAPAVLVTPLGGLSILVCTVLSSRFLGERMNLYGHIGCVTCGLGAVLLVLHAPKEQSVASLADLLNRFFSSEFIIFAAFVLLLAALLIFVLGPRYGKRNPLIYTAISGSIGSLSVMSCKGLGIAIKEGIQRGLSFLLSSGFFWFLLAFLVVSLPVQLYYLSRALDLFNTGSVTALLYVLFTGFVLVASGTLYQEWHGVLLQDYIELVVSLILITIGILMITLLKDSRCNQRVIAQSADASHRSEAAQTATLEKKPTLHHRFRGAVVAEDRQLLLDEYAAVDSDGFCP